MQRPLSRLPVWLRVRGGTAVLAAVALFAVLHVVVPSEAVLVPGRAGVRGLLWPLLPAVWLIPILAFAELWDRPLERIASRPLWRSATLLTVAATATGVLAAYASPVYDAEILVRNLAYLAGFGALCAAVAPAALRWFAPFAVPVGMWLMGTDGVGTAKAWAVLFHPVTTEANRNGAAVVAASGAVAFIARSAAADGIVSATRHRSRVRSRVADRP